MEGFTEFLPISSTAHLIIAQRLLGLATVSVFFTTVVQLGALGGLIVQERKKLWTIIVDGYAALISLFREKDAKASINLFNSKLIALGLGTIPVAIVGLCISNVIEQIQASILLIAAMSIIVGLFLLYAQKIGSQAKGKVVTTKNIFIMGIYQAISLLPGTSRSGIVAAGGMVQGISLSESLEYSFLMSVPSLLLAGGYELVKQMRQPMDMNIIVPTLVATTVAFIAAMISIEALRSMVRKVGFTPFVIYRILFAIFLIIFFLR